MKNLSLFVKFFKVNNYAILQAENKKGETINFWLSETKINDTINDIAFDCGCRLIFEKSCCYSLRYNIVNYRKRNKFYRKAILRLIYFLIKNIGNKKSFLIDKYGIFRKDAARQNSENN